MDILVCVKQVLDITEIKADPQSNRLLTDGVPMIVNPYDTYALEAAVRIKDAHPGSRVVVLSLGPEEVKAALKECLAVGGDKAYLVSDPAFEDGDSLATARALAAAVRKVEEAEGPFDLIFCGNQAINGDTAQTGPQLAELLDLPQLTFGTDAVVTEGVVQVKREAELGCAVAAAKLPCLVCITQCAYEPRYPTIKSKMAAGRAQIPVLTAADLALSGPVGRAGSPTTVERTDVPPARQGGDIIDEGNVEESVRKLAELLSGAAII